MGRFYSDTLDEAIQLLYFQANPVKFPRGIELLEQAVCAKEPDAYYFLARCYGWGDGNVKEDVQKARQLSHDGIELGSDLCVLGADRMNELNGNVKAAMTHTLAESFQAVLKMARDGDPMAQYAIGLFYFWGDMLMNIQKPSKEDTARCEQENALEAVKWFRLSAEQGCIPAFRNAFNGVRGGINNVKKDVPEAMRWMESVKDKVDLRDYYVSIVYEYQDLRDYANACRWCHKGVEAGDTSCAVVMGLGFLNGEKGFPMKEPEAFSLFRVAAEHGDEYGHYNLGRCYYNGWGCIKDFDKAFKCFEQASKMNHPAADTFLSRCYYWGRGVQEDSATAFRLAKQQKDKERSYPSEILGMCYLYGKGTPVDYVHAKEQLQKAAPDYAAASHSLGVMYDRGMGVAEDVNIAVSYYQKAAAKGYEPASDALKGFKKALFGKWKRI